MKSLIVIAVAALIAGCAPTKVIVQKEVVTVDKPIPYVPTPPTVPKCNYLVDQLQPSDIADPGKVGQAYKHDMDCLRQVNKIHELVLEQYRSSSQDFTKINAEIDKLFKQINTPIPTNR